MKIIKGDLVLEEDTFFGESIKVSGNIRGKNGERFNLRVVGNIDAGDIKAWNIDARDIDAGDMKVWNIDAENIYARDIEAGDIICVSRKKKSRKSKTIAYSIVLDRFFRERKEVMPE